ncbi:MAG TPA: hypothetical protein VF505_09710 [Thermoanaerobaculia bacterium]
MPVRWAYLKRVLAGAIFGMYMAHLLYFLNPQVDISPFRLVAVTLVYAAICGLLFGSALWLLRWIRVKLFGKAVVDDGEYRAHGFGFVVVSAFFAAIIYAIHLSVLRIYLPVGAVRILNKATIVIAVTACILFILWLLERNADRATSRAIFVTGVALIATSSFFLYQRRESYRTEKRNVVVANVGTVAGRRPLIVIAIRNLPYDWILTMSGDGTLPWLGAATKRWYFTRIEPFPTTTPDALWASLATGKLPYRHGVTGRFSFRTPLSGPDPSERFLLLPSGVAFGVWGLIPPVQRISAQLPAGDSLPFWKAFQRLSLRAEVTAWPAVQSDVHGDPRAVAAIAERFSGAGAARSRILGGLAADEAAIAMMERGRGLDLRVVALEGFSEAQKALHIFTNDLPARSSMKGAALRAYAHEIDRLLESVARDNPDHLIVICSPSGVVPPELRATAWSLLSEELSNIDPGADDGFVLIAGHGTAHSTNPESAVEVDVVPTLLFAAGLPVGRDMDGRILTEAFDDEFLRQTKLSAIPTYEAEQLVVRHSGV